MAIIKHGVRSVRKPCTGCGRKDGLYWAHDTSKRTGKVITSCKECPELTQIAGWVRIERDGSVHNCKNTGRPVADSSPEHDEIPESGPEPKPALPAKPVPATVTAAVAETGADLDRARLLLELMNSGQPKLDESRVRDIVAAQHAEHNMDLIKRINARLSEITAPLRIEVKRPDGTVKPLTGVSHSSLPDILLDVRSGEHVLMVGPAGTGKSTIAEQVAEAMGLEYASISLNPQTTASALLGYMQAEGKYVSTLYRQRYENGGVFHFDELDNAHPSILATLNASLANGQMAYPDGMVKRHPDFYVLASANTYGRGPDRKYVGRQAIDAATLDRFTIETIGYDERLETSLCEAMGLEARTTREVLRYVRAIRAQIDRHNMPLIMGVRASLGMCRLLKAGRPMNAVIEARVRRGISDSDWSKITLGITKPSTY